jgi:hypothetical protein
MRGILRLIPVNANDILAWRAAVYDHTELLYDHLPVNSLFRAKGPLMKRCVYWGAAILLVFSATALFAADVTGSWTGTVSGPNGDFKLTFAFKQDGTKLTGTVTGPQGAPLDITDGKVEGNKIGFNVSLNGMTIQHDGVINGDEINLTTKTDDPNFPGGQMTLTRVK